MNEKQTEQDTTSGAARPLHHESGHAKRGCFFYGCLSAAVLSVIIVVATFFAVRGAIKWLVNNYTTTTPVEIPAIDVTSKQYSSAKEKIDDFAEALRTGNGPAELTLTAQDLNILFAGHPELNKSGLKVFFDFSGDDVGGKVSLNLSDLGYPGRYLTGEGTFSVSIENGLALVFLKTLTINGQPVPEQVLSELKGQNLAADATKDKETIEKLKKIKSLTVKDGVITVVRHT